MAEIILMMATTTINSIKVKPPERLLARVDFKRPPRTWHGNDPVSALLANEDGHSPQQEVENPKTYNSRSNIFLRLLLIFKV